MSNLPDVHAAEPIPPRVMVELERLMQSGDLFRYTAPSESPVALLECEFAAMMGTAYALAVSSCSAALFLSLKALDLPRDARVLIPGFTFAAVPSAVVHAECRPVLCEVGDTYRIDLDDFIRKIDDDISAFLISHMRGHTSDMDTILEVCDARGIPVIEDAAHSLGTLWNGRKIGTIGRVGCFSFQSYKMINAGEGGILVTDDDDLVARAIIMSGAYEHNWKKHDVVRGAFARWQNRLPLYNMRMGNLSATVIRAQLPELERRCRDGLANHDQLAARLGHSPHIRVPASLPGERRAPDSIQFNLLGLDDGRIRAFAAEAEARGVKVQVFGQATDNARAFWNWQFIEDLPELPQTRAMLMRACDVRLPVQLGRADIDAVGDVLLGALAEAVATRCAAE